MNILGNSAEIVGFVLFLGMVVVYLRGSKDKGTIATLEASNRALTERVAILEADALATTARHATERAADAADRARLSARLGAVERENVGLLAQRPSAEVVAGIAVELHDVHGALTQHDADIKALLSEDTDD
jgi:hypothetical protein